MSRPRASFACPGRDDESAAPWEALEALTRRSTSKQRLMTWNRARRLRRESGGTRARQLMRRSHGGDLCRYCDYADIAAVVGLNAARCLERWPDDPEIIERIPIRSCQRRGVAIDLVLDRPRENRS